LEAKQTSVPLTKNDGHDPKPKCKSPCGCDKGALLGTVVAASHQFRTEVARLGSRSDDFEVFGGDTGCAVTGVVVLGVEVFQVAAERGLGRFAKPGKCFQSRAVMNPIEVDRFRNRERKFELR
jgi:hypothetical protein